MWTLLKYLILITCVPLIAGFVVIVFVFVGHAFWSKHTPFRDGVRK